MGVHPYQIADLNWNFFQNGPISNSAGSYSSEFGIALDNVNANASRYMRLQAIWANVAIGPVSSSPSSDSFGQATGVNNNNTDSHPVRPNGGYFVRGLYFTNTAIPTNDSTGAFRVGYVGSFVGGLEQADYAHDANGSTVDYEPIYTHGAATFPMTASQAKQWRDTPNPPVDQTDAVVNSGSALSRSIYMPASYMLMHIDSAGGNTLGSGNVKFHFENRPTLHMAGYSDNNGQGQPNVNSWTGAHTTSAYSSDPLRSSGQLSTSATDNFHELYQVTGVRKLNSRGLSFHLAKVFDNSALAYAYPYEEDGLTLGTGVTLNAPGGNNIQYPYTYVNDQQEYTWAGGRDQGASVLNTSVAANVVTFTTTTMPTPFTTGQVVLVQGLTVHTELNGALLTVLAGATTSSFTANWTHSNYAAAGDNGAVVAKPDFRIRQSASFIINEEYYGTVMDTKVAIWSNKASMVPLIFRDLADVWTGSTAKRIAGVSVVPVYGGGSPTWQIFFLSEDGKLARYDFTQTNGVLELAGSGTFSFASNAPAVAAAGEAYGSLRARSTSSTITNIAITTNVLTVSCVNTFEAGEIVNLQGLTTATFLNNQTVTVVTPGGSSFTAAFTHADYASAPDTGTAVGYSLWALYGTMTPDPRVPQTGLANTANINVYRYLIGTGVWGSKIASPNTGRHNGRSLSEMTVARDGKLYILCEDVTTSAGFNVSNAYSTAGSAATVTSVQITSNVATVQSVNTLSAGQSVLLNNFGSAAFLNGQVVTVLATGLSGSQFEFNFVHANYGPTVDTGTATIQNNVNWQVMAFDPIAATWNASKINGTVATQILQYGTNFGTPANNSFLENRDYWFQNINAFLHDVGTNKILIQPNWTVGPNNGDQGTTLVGLQVLDVSGSTSTLSNSNLTTIQRGTILPNDSFIPSSAVPEASPVSIVHARDFATNADRTVFFIHDFARNASTSMPLYLAPPSYNWGAPTALAQIQRNNYNFTPPIIQSFQKDFWSYISVNEVEGQPGSTRYAWVQPMMLMDNYLTYIVGSTGVDGLPGQSTYGRAFGQGMGFLPTYWKWNGSAWIMADNWADAAASPRTIPAANTNISLPYGLQVQYGPASGTSYTFGEFQTFNMAYGNTKFARKLRQSFAQFAGQTFTNTDTRTIASQNALSMHLIDTDLGTVTNTAPTSATPHTAVLTNPNLGWVTASVWNKLDAGNAPFDATPYQTVWNVNTAAFNTSTFTNPPAANVSGTGPGPYTWTVGATTYAVTASGEANGGTLAWFAVNGNPQTNWQSSFGNTGWVKIDLASAQTVLSYGFRPIWSGSDVLDGSTPKSWTLEGSATGVFGGEQVTVDTRTNFVTTTRGVSFNCNGATGSFRYYRFNISASVTGANPTLSMLRLNTSVLQTSVNFSEMVFYAYGSRIGATYIYPFIRNWQMARGITLETSTNNGVSYTTVFAPGVTSPQWRALGGYVWTFPRQTGVTNVRVTVQHGYNYNTSSNGTNQPQVTGFGPFYFIDYGVAQATLDAARLGSSLALPATPAAASFDPNCLGIACDVPNISIDSANPSLISATNIFVDSVVHGFYDFNFVPDATHSGNALPGFKMHPFFGFIFFQGAGGSGGVSTQTGTNAVINYQWGRRV